MEKYILQYEINYRKSVNAILYVINKMGGSVKEYNLLKILFAADKLNLNQAAGPITGDQYYKEDNGTVPREIYYDIIRGGNTGPCLKAIEENKLPFTVSTKGEDSIISSAVPYNPRRLAIASRQRLDRAIKEYGGLTFAEARTKNHQEKCWQQTPDNQRIPFELMVDDSEILDYILDGPNLVV